MKTWSTIDKSIYESRGEWDDEPDKAQWIDEDSNLDCLIVRGPSGALCGYVGVPESHPCFEMDYNDVYDKADIQVHGGLTFANRCADTADESRHICHFGDVANKTVWWLGFDCAHSGDVSPSYKATTEWFSSYKNFNYVKIETAYLARQLSEIGE